MINITVLLGRIVADPELKQTPSGNSVVNFTLAVERSHCKSGEERQCDFLDCVAWRGTAEFISKYFHKGNLIAVIGEIQTRTYEDKSGKNHKVTEILVSSASFCESKKNNSNPDSNPYPAAGKSTRSKAETNDFEEIQGDEELPF